jgi:hypothetical protein
MEYIMRVGTILQFVGGRIGGLAFSGVLLGIFLLVFGVSPGEFAANVFQNPPAWLLNPWIGFVIIVIGLLVIWGSLSFNIWSNKQKAIDDLAEDIAFAIRDLIAHRSRPQTEVEIDKWKKDFDTWCNRVSKKLENRAFSHAPISFTLTVLVLFRRLQ